MFLPPFSGLAYPVPMIGAANAVAGIVGVMTAIWRSFPQGGCEIRLRIKRVRPFPSPDLTPELFDNIFIGPKKVLEMG